MSQIICPACRTPFTAKRADAQFCSPACRKKANRDPGALMLAEADRLTDLQRAHRGYEPGPEIDGKPTLRLGPYVPTPESEARAQQIINLRRNQARLEHPIH